MHNWRRSFAFFRCLCLQATIVPAQFKWLILKLTPLEQNFHVWMNQLGKTDSNLVLTTVTNFFTRLSQILECKYKKVHWEHRENMTLRNNIWREKLKASCEHWFVSGCGGCLWYRMIRPVKYRAKTPTMGRSGKLDPTLMPVQIPTAGTRLETDPAIWRKLKKVIFLHNAKQNI